MADNLDHGSSADGEDPALSEDLDMFLEVEEPSPAQNGPLKSSEELQKELQELQRKMQAIQDQLSQKVAKEQSSPVPALAPKKLPRFSNPNLKSLKSKQPKPSSHLSQPSTSQSLLHTDDHTSHTKPVPSTSAKDPSTSKTLSSLDQEDIFVKEGSNVKLAPQVESSSLLLSTDLLDSSDEERERNPMESKFLTETGRLVKKRFSHTTTSLNSKPQLPAQNIWNKKSSTTTSSNTFQFQAGTSTAAKNENVETDFYSGLRIVNPKVSSVAMKTRMEGRKMIRMSLIPLHMRGGDIEGDWVTIGVLVSKLPPKVTKNGKPFSIWKLSDLKDCNKLMSLFLFGEVHTQHWKTSVGSVLALLNPSFLDSNTNQNNDKISIKVDHPGKIMLMGSSKDMGTCKAKRRNGELCNNLVNLSLCEFCEYHVKSEYKKVSSKRSELQSSYSGMTPRPNGLRDKLSKQQFFYGGQMVVPPPPVRVPTASKKVQSATAAKDQLTLQSLGLKRKAEVIENDIVTRPVAKMPHLTDGENQALTEVAQTSDFLAERLSVPSPGARTFLKYVMKKKSIEEKVAGAVRSVTPKDLLEMHKRQLQKSPDTPQIGKGLRPQDTVNLALTGKPSPPSLAKRKAIELVKTKGLQTKTDPNSPALKRKKIEKALQSQVSDQSKPQPSKSPPQVLKTSGLLDPNSEKFQRLLKKKSSHANEVEDFHQEKEERYFDHLEKKERMEEKMLSVTEIKCSVVSCHQCRYTSHHPAERCQKENHPLKYHKAMKRFFQCKSCKNRTWCFSKVPSKPCQNCGTHDYERTTMGKAKSGPKIAGETLLIRGEELKFINS